MPWEYRGSSFDPTQHAVTSLELGGRKRDFLLKMRGGIIYFKEPKRAPIFAVLRQFDTEMRGDELAKEWKREVERENFGRCYARSADFQRCPGKTVIVAIIRSDFSGWISDAFHTHWHVVPKHRDRKILNVWEASANTGTWRAFLRVRDALRDRDMLGDALRDRDMLGDALRDRDMLASERQTIAPHWVTGNEIELQRIFAIVMQLYVHRGVGNFSHTWKFGATNMASQGGFLHTFNPNYYQDLRFSATLVPLVRLLNQHFLWVGMDWKHHDTRFFSPMRGNDWRGAYSIVTPSLELTVPLVAILSNHERLELSLELRDWLTDKVSPRRIDSWLSQVLD